MASRQVATGRLADQVSERLRESIFDGRYEPAHKMLPEHELTATFGLSRVEHERRTYYGVLCRRRNVTNGC